MVSKVLNHPFELYTSDFESWTVQPLIYHYFEIVQVLEGEGKRLVNGNAYPYSTGSIFLFTPLDCRGFEVLNKTRFCSIRFSEVFLGGCKTDQEREKIAGELRHLEQVFSSHNRFREITLQNPDSALLSSLIRNMADEFESKRSHYEENLRHLITMVLNILLRNISGCADHNTLSPTEALISRLSIYIGQNISNPENLRIGQLAERFNLSPNYISEYFKNSTGQSLQRYISTYKLKMVCQRLQHSSLPVSQIANELGFTDESHLSRQFRKHYNISPSEFRRLYRKTLSAL